MGHIVGHVAALGLEIDRDSSVLGDGEDEEQLFEIGPVVLVMAPGDGQPGLSPATVFLGGVGVVAEEGHGGGVVVQLFERDREFADGMCSDGQGEGTTVAAEELVQGSAKRSSLREAICWGSRPKAAGW